MKSSHRSRREREAPADVLARPRVRIAGRRNRTRRAPESQTKYKAHAGGATRMGNCAAVVLTSARRPSTVRPVRLTIVPRTSSKPMSCFSTSMTAPEPPKTFRRPESLRHSSRCTSCHAIRWTRRPRRHDRPSSLTSIVADNSHVAQKAKGMASTQTAASDHKAAVSPVLFGGFAAPKTRSNRRKGGQSQMSSRA